MSCSYSINFFLKTGCINAIRKRNKAILEEYNSAIEKTIKETLQQSFEKGQENVEKQIDTVKDVLDIEIKLPQDEITEKGVESRKPQKIIIEQQGIEDVASNKVIDVKVETSKAPKNVEELPKAPREENFFGVNDKKLEALQETIKNDLDKAQNAVLRKMDDIYRQTIFKTHVYFQNGTVTLNQAVDMATKDFLDKGINSIQYKNGANVNIASYAEMALRTASHRATLLGEGKKRDEWGLHLVVVSAHANTCKHCEPWQGKVLIDDVFSHPSKEYIEENKKYPLLSEAIEKGLLHPNCRHTLTTFFPGITKLPVVPDGKEAIKTYEAEQKQRALERQIRKWKRVEAGACDLENQEKAHAKVKELEDKLRQHLKDNPQLRRDYDREKADIRSIKQINSKYDLKEFNKYKEVLGEEAPKTLEDFQKLKYNKIEEWRKVKNKFSEVFVTKDFDSIPSFHENCSNLLTRKWYKWHDENIPNLIDTSKSIEEQARQAHELRNAYRTQARDLMKDQKERKNLDMKHPNPSFEELIEHKKLKYGISNEEAYVDIIRSSQTTNKKYDKIAGIKEE